ncbi:hypothetical protein Acr_01g0015200 [Actinidia rufa]|uniref:NET domain-containing protein n=1 Tax=Actinidia rufa TaxID=165716 RepID=A0A7J0E617_9ERIC|nr:hypothetical protein Acr_01g0015200 [Actinidia rufa]
MSGPLSKDPTSQTSEQRLSISLAVQHQLAVSLDQIIRAHPLPNQSWASHKVSIPEPLTHQAPNPIPRYDAKKKRLGTALTRLSADDLNKALLIVAQNNPNFQVTAEVVDLDMDAQSESTLWKLKFFVKEALQVQGKSAASLGENNHHNDNNNKRKREICDALAKTTQKRSKKLPS